MPFRINPRTNTFQYTPTQSDSKQAKQTHAKQTDILLIGLKDLPDIQIYSTDKIYLTERRAGQPYRIKADKLERYTNRTDRNSQQTELETDIPDRKRMVLDSQTNSYDRPTST